MSSTNLSAAAMFDLSSVVAVVTGGSSGIGGVIADGLAQNGATVYILGRRFDRLYHKALQYREGNMIPLKCDVTSKDDLQRAAMNVKNQHGYINFLVCNAGAKGPSSVQMHGEPSTDIKQLQKELWDVPTEGWATVFEINAAAVYYSAVAFLDLLHEGSLQSESQGINSSILTISSIASKTKCSTPGFPYHASKAAATKIGQNLAHCLAPMNIRSNVILPGPFPSSTTKQLSDDAIAKLNPLGRIGHPSEIAGLVVMLASKAGGYFNGSVIVADGGRLLTIGDAS